MLFDPRTIVPLRCDLHHALSNMSAMRSQESFLLQLNIRFHLLLDCLYENLPILSKFTTSGNNVLSSNVFRS